MQSTDSYDVHHHDHESSGTGMQKYNKKFNMHSYHTSDETQNASAVPCQGLFDRKFEILYSDGNAGATTALKLWTDKHQEGSDGKISTSDNQEVNV